MQENEERTVLCGASSYEQKYYFNEEFSALPQRVKDELKVSCVMYVEEVGGVLTLEYEPDGELEFKVTSDEADYLFDDIGSALKIKEIRRDKSDLLESLEMYYKVFWLNEE